jgi:hypothetical protein
MINHHPLNGAIERVRRAGKHLNDLRSYLAPLSGESNRVVVEQQIAGMNEIKTDMLLEVGISMMVPILVGEICYNLRSALDYLIYELITLDAGVPKHKTQFPIEDREKHFLGRKKGWLYGLDERHIACIEWLQPYNGCDWTKSLREVSNPDKHRGLTPAAGEISYIMFIRGEHASFDDLPLPIQRAPHPVTGIEVEVKVHVTGSILFSDGTPVMETLEKLILNVGETIEAFKPEFQRR